MSLEMNEIIVKIMQLFSPLPSFISCSLNVMKNIPLAKCFYYYIYFINFHLSII